MEWGSGTIKGPYTDRAIKKRILALFQDNIGLRITNRQIMEVAKNPVTGEYAMNFHRRLDELRTDGYTIFSSNDKKSLKKGEYIMPTNDRRPPARRVYINEGAWKIVKERAKNKCEMCGLEEGDIDPISGIKVILTADHKKPHTKDPNVDPDDPDMWKALCKRCQSVKRNFWDDITGEYNIEAIVRSLPMSRKEKLYLELKSIFE